MKSIIVILFLAMNLYSCTDNKTEVKTDAMVEEKMEGKEVAKSEVNPDTKSKMEAYFKSHDTAYVAEDAVFTNMSTGEVTKGRKAIAGMLNYIYHEAFDARADIKHTMVTDKNAVLEATFTGKNIGSFAGMPATNKEVSVPLCVTYDLNESGLIKEARIYMLGSVMMEQLKK